MRGRGLTYSQIGAEFGVTRQAAHLMVQRAYRDVPTEDVEQAKAIELMKLDAIERRAHLIVARKHVLVSPSGKIVERVTADADGRMKLEELEDDMPTIKALELLLKVAERRARLLGLNAPTNIRVSEVVSYDTDAIDAKLEEWRTKYRAAIGTAALLDGGPSSNGAATA
jgi:hypothetical protein